MSKYLPVICFFILFNCSKKDVFNTPEVLEVVNEIDFVKTFGGTKNDALYSVKETTDGGYIVAGCAQSNDFDLATKTNDSFDFLVSKFNSENSLEWQKTFGGSEDDRAADIVQTLSGSFVVLGYSKSSDSNVSENAGSKDFWLLKLSNNGVLLWEKTFGFSGADYGTALLETTDGGFLITGVLDVSSSDGQGNAKSNKLKHAGGDYWSIKTDNAGNLEWSRFFGGSFTEIPSGVIETTQGNFIIAGSSDSSDFNVSENKGAYDFWITKISPTGELLLEKTFGGSEIDEASAII
ncbi:MAG: hypothetical protein QMC35_11655, partial [Polaribacter sp.]